MDGSFPWIFFHTNQRSHLLYGVKRNQCSTTFALGFCGLYLLEYWLGLLLLDDDDESSFGWSFTTISMYNFLYSLYLFVFSTKRLFFPFLYYFEVSDLWSLSQDGRIGSIYSFIHINNLCFLYIIFQTMGASSASWTLSWFIEIDAYFLLIWV